MPLMARDGLLSVSPAAAGVTVSLSVVFCYFLFLPLWHTDLWGHLSYGRYLHQTTTLPETEPLMPLSEGVSFRNREAGIAMRCRQTTSLRRAASAVRNLDAHGHRSLALRTLAESRAVQPGRSVTL